MVRERNDLLVDLECAVRRRMGEHVRVENLRLLSGGASAESWMFDVEEVEPRRSCVLRLARRAVATGLGKTTEARVQRAARAAGVPTPEVYFVLDEPDGLGDGYVMQAIDGESLARRILRDERFAAARRVMARQCGEILQKIHAADVTALDDLNVESPQQQLASLRDTIDRFGQSLPVFEVALCWLHDRLPGAAEPRLVHGDFRNGNFMVGPEGIRAVLDWELAHRGDPMEDLGWLCVNSWRFGHLNLPVGGFGDRETLFAAYEAAGGGRVEPELVRFWEVYGTLRWGVICLIQAQTHLSGDVRSVEHAAIGRRVSETEIDLLQLIDARRGNPSR